MKYKNLNMQSTERKTKIYQEQGRLIAIENYFPRGGFWMKTQTLGTTLLCEALLNPHVLTCVPLFSTELFLMMSLWD